MIVVVSDPNTGSSTSIGGATREDCLEGAIYWLGADFHFIEDAE